MAFSRYIVNWDGRGLIISVDENVIAFVIKLL